MAITDTAELKKGVRLKTVGLDKDLNSIHGLSLPVGRGSIQLFGSKQQQQQQQQQQQTL